MKHFIFGIICMPALIQCMQQAPLSSLTFVTADNKIHAVDVSTMTPWKTISNMLDHSLENAHINIPFDKATLSTFIELTREPILLKTTLSTMSDDTLSATMQIAKYFEDADIINACAATLVDRVIKNPQTAASTVQALQGDLPVDVVHNGLMQNHIQRMIETLILKNSSNFTVPFRIRQIAWCNPTHIIICLPYFPHNDACLVDFHRKRVRYINNNRFVKRIITEIICNNQQTQALINFSKGPACVLDMNTGAILVDSLGKSKVCKAIWMDDGEHILTHKHSNAERINTIQNTKKQWSHIHTIIENRFLVKICAEGDIIIIDAATDTQRILSGHTHKVHTCIYDKEANCLYSIDVAGRMRVGNLQNYTSKSIHALEASSGKTFFALYKPSVVLYGNKNLQECTLCDVRTGAMVPFRTPCATPSAITMLPGYGMLVTDNNAHTVYYDLEAHTATSLHDLVGIPDNETITSCKYNKDIATLHIATLLRNQHHIIPSLYMYNYTNRTTVVHKKRAQPLYITKIQSFCNACPRTGKVISKNYGARNLAIFNAHGYQVNQHVLSATTECCAAWNGNGSTYAHTAKQHDDRMEYDLKITPFVDTEHLSYSLSCEQIVLLTAIKSLQESAVYISDLLKTSVYREAYDNLPNDLIMLYTTLLYKSGGSVQLQPLAVSAHEQEGSEPAAKRQKTE